MISENDRKFVHDFLRQHSLAVLSTVSSEGQPQSAVLEYGETENLEIIFDTNETGRKVRNIERNSKVSLAIGWDDNRTLQYEGTASRLEGDALTDAQKTYWAKNPRAERWAARPGIIYFLVRPTQIRYSDLETDPWDVREFTFA